MPLANRFRASVQFVRLILTENRCYPASLHIEAKERTPPAAHIIACG
jgi:hypothetical protein